MASTFSEEGILNSLRKYELLRSNATNVVRPDGSNVDVVVDNSTGDKVVICHLIGLLPFHMGNYAPVSLGFEDTASIALAAHQMNTGDGSIVPEIAGLDERCKIRFTVEAADSEFDGGKSLRQVNKLTNRDPTGSEALPCAFIGPYRSAVSISTSIILGTYGYPQVSPGSVSDELDDKSQYPLFGRTVPSDSGNAIPLVLYLRDVLQLDHIAVIHVNDAFGNGYANFLRKAADEHAPNLRIRQITLELKEGSFETAVSDLKATGYRFVLAALFTRETHDALLTEAYRQGVAGDGLHNWLFAASFAGVLEGRAFEKGSPLHLAYRGVGLLQVSAGVPGIPNYDKYLAKMGELRNPMDMNYLSSKFPSYDQPAWEGKAPHLSNPNFLKTITSGNTPFAYEAAIALGLSACASISDDALTGSEHATQMRKAVFESISGKQLVFNNVTGTRDPKSALYKVTNYVEEESDGSMVFMPTTAFLFQDSAWVEVNQYIFNDGTSVLPIDIAPFVELKENWLSTPVLYSGIFAIAVFLGMLALLIHERRRKSNSALWKVKRDELIFNDPPEVIGRGTFGLVVLAKYRGTKVAVKRVIPLRNSMRGGSSPGETVDNDNDVETGISECVPAVAGSVERSYGSTKTISTMASVERRTKKSSDELTRKYELLKKEFIQEMSYFSQLRHPCVVTIMGAAIDKGHDPMLVMEYMENGSLYTLLHNATIVVEGEILLPILRDISQGMRFLHAASPQIIHGDLKAANILVDNRFRAKVADFGISMNWKKNRRCTGTPFWMAPELLRGESGNTSASDVFSFGVILYEVYSRKDPYFGEPASSILPAVMDPKICKRVTAPEIMPTPIQILMEECLQESPAKRPSYEEIDVRLQRLDAEAATPIDTKGKSQRPLEDIFPKRIVDVLRAGRKVEPEHKDCVTLLYGNIVGLSDDSTGLGPQKIGNLQDRLYQQFDGILAKHDLHRVETIGSSYMVAANLVKDQPDDQSKRVVQFAMEAIQIANRTVLDEKDSSKRCALISVGVHTGPVIAEVVGHRSPRYCLFGDTVTTTVSMESTSGINRINCSAKTAALLTEQWKDLSLVDRGEVFVRGKGLMNCFWVQQDSSTISPLDRVRAMQQARKKQAALSAETSLNSSSYELQHSAVAIENMTSAKQNNGDEDLADLEGSLKNRLARTTTSSQSSGFN